jgi:hypothetical protein
MTPYILEMKVVKEESSLMQIRYISCESAGASFEPQFSF